MGSNCTSLRKQSRIYNFETHIQKVVENMSSNNARTQMQATKMAAKILENNNAPIHQLIHFGIVPRCAEILQRYYNPTTQVEASYILTRIMSLGTQQQRLVIVKAGIIPRLVELLRSTNEIVVKWAAMALAIIIAKGGSLARDLLLKAGAVPELLKFMRTESSAGCLDNIVWTITHLTCGTEEQIKAVVKAEAVPTFIKLLESTDESVVEASVIALGKIAGRGGPTVRDLVLNAGTMSKLLDSLRKHTQLKILRSILYAIRCLCENYNCPPAFYKVRQCIPTLAEMIYFEDDEVIRNTCWALFNLTCYTSEKIQVVIKSGIVSRLVELLGNSEGNILMGTMLTVGSIARGGDTERDVLIQAGCIPQLALLLKHSDLVIVKVSVWIMLTITTGTIEQIQAVIKARIIPSLIQVLEKYDYVHQKKEFEKLKAMIFQDSQSYRFSKSQVKETFYESYLTEENRTILCVLKTIKNILIAAKTLGEMDRIAIVIEECGGFDKLKSLQKHQNARICRVASCIIAFFYK